MAGAPTLAVTGSTGHLGGLVARQLADAGSRQRLLVRDPGRAPELQGAVPGIFTYADRILSESALTGVQTLFMVSAAEAEDRLQQHRTFVDAAAAVGVQHIVYTSFFGAAPDCTFTLGRDHFATEEHIRASGMEFTFLRDNFYLDFLPLLAGDDGVIRGPAGQGAMAAVARADIARSAVAVLRDPALHVGRTYSLTGPEDISLATAADLLTAKTGRTITFQNETLEEAYASRAPFEVPRWQVDAWVSTYTAIAAGELAGPTPAVHELTGREPLSLTQLLDDSHKI
ncbi:MULTISPECIES: SDR family oxidoreductase [unclassified Arthrobacter]|uniref:SDR family oxidoreductase n=1 Tax=unclassified Arthrobacter TaxID=235627 RepID=UPI002E04377A|nr:MULTISPECIES: SDR family oxidoreductase [unclassified Arthrobacter]MEC5190670.1 NAD(P)H dehydrogenase (quinone) [Arthrobacter sp. MP_M4]MEC5202754.1 NAD(P)H dehydrogenase (quinone) [Arthrobacter sp. MP_M7]